MTDLGSTTMDEFLSRDDLPAEMVEFFTYLTENEELLERAKESPGEVLECANNGVDITRPLLHAVVLGVLCEQEHHDGAPALDTPAAFAESGDVIRAEADHDFTIANYFGYLQARTSDIVDVPDTGPSSEYQGVSIGDALEDGMEFGRLWEQTVR